MQQSKKAGRGRIGGRGQLLDSSERAMAVRLFNEKQHSVDQICRLVGVSRPTLYKYVNAVKVSVEEVSKA